MSKERESILYWPDNERVIIIELLLVLQCQAAENIGPNHRQTNNDKRKKMINVTVFLLSFLEQVIRYMQNSICAQKNKIDV